MVTDVVYVCMCMCVCVCMCMYVRVCVCVIVAGVWGAFGFGGAYGFVVTSLRASSVPPLRTAIVPVVGASAPVSGGGGKVAV